MKTHTISGIGMWCKIIGAPRPGYDEDSLEWTFDLALNEINRNKLLELGVAPQYIKTKEGMGEYIRFTRKAVKADGDEGKPFNIVNHKGEPWGNDLIGNGSELNVKITIKEISQGKNKRLKPQALAIQVWKHVKFKSNAFPTREDTTNDTPGEEEAGW